MICVIGDSILDEYIFGKSERISPEAPVPIIHNTRKEIRLGGSSNVANNLYSLKNKIDYISVVGDDESGLKFKSLISDIVLSSKSIFVDNNKCTTVKSRIISNNQQIVRVDNENTIDISDKIENKIIKYFTKNIKNYNVVIFSDYSKGLLTDRLTKELLEICNKNKVISIVDPKNINFNKYKGATIITPNKKEASLALGINLKSDKEINIALRTLKSKFLIKTPIITLSENGMAALLDNKIERFNADVKEVFDVTGAGDTVVAVLAHFLNKNNKIKTSIHKANLAGGIVVGKQGTSVITLSEIEHNNEKQKKIVFTNGCFDILHRGHINYLKEARSLGDYLIIGINSDESVKRLKGKNRPINNLSDRILMLESLKFVDEVIPFYEDDPYELIKRVQPDILVKGGDYKNKVIVGSDLVNEVKLVNFTEGYSTTNFLDKTV
tara:strand:- start:12224 stop:13540 length:1317 start_codon:yes stop_codon:yes gene_type:complete